MRRLYQLAKNRNVKIVDDKLLPNINGVYYRDGKIKLIILKNIQEKHLRRLPLLKSSDITLQSMDMYFFN